MKRIFAWTLAALLVLALAACGSKTQPELPTSLVSTTEAATDAAETSAATDAVTTEATADTTVTPDTTAETTPSVPAPRGHDRNHG